MNNIVSIENISKFYRLYDRPIDRLKELLWIGKKTFHKKFWVLKNISFDIKKGEVFGIIGMNGAGKTTLLQILSEILPPSEGEVSVRGNVLSLIELGSGINFEFTGRENIIQYGLVLGQAKKYLEKNIDKAIDFADIGHFIDHPVKTYSTGMVMRLAFSVITICRPDILFVDEIISVGDMNFRMKCLNWIDDFISNGGTLCIVSHDIHLISNKCGKVLYLKNGKTEKIGAPLEVVNSYRYDCFNAHPETVEDDIKISTDDLKKGYIAKNIKRKGNLKAFLTKTLINGKPIGSEIFIEQGEPITLDMEAVFTKNFKNYSFCFTLLTHNGCDIFSVSSGLTKTPHPEIIPNKPMCCTITVEQTLQPGTYFILSGLADVPSQSTAELFDIIEVYTKIIVTGISEMYGYISFPYSIDFSEPS
ncbi:ABC transporter ATP-binding protein [bacterium]|nr:ABC transporter ATP-binding protein [bacterium]